MRPWIFDRLAFGLAAAVLGAACSSHSTGEAAPAPAPASATADTSAAPTTSADTTTASTPAAPRTGASATGADSTAHDSSAAAPGARDTASEQATEMNPNPGGASSAGGTSATASSGTADSSYVQYDAGSKTVTFRLVAGPFTFDGYSNGGATLTVPPGTNNVWNFEQGDGTPHSAEIESGEGPLPNSGGNPAIPRAYTNKVVEGLPQGATDVIKFTAPAQGTYRIICGVPGHAVGGMWIWFKIDPSAKTPSLTATPKK